MTASTPSLREPDGLYRSYRIQWLEEVEHPVGLLLLIGGRQTANLLSARALQPHVIVPIVPIVSDKFGKTWQHVEMRNG